MPKRIATALTAIILTSALAIPITATENSLILVSGHKRSILSTVGCSGLIIALLAIRNTAISIKPSTVTVE